MPTDMICIQSMRSFGLAKIQCSIRYSETFRGTLTLIFRERAHTLTYLHHFTFSLIVTHFPHSRYHTPEWKRHDTAIYCF